ncbi:MAG: hypothetical protein AAF429_11790 [Pseudomonadota bacterium]
MRILFAVATLAFAPAAFAGDGCQYGHGAKQQQAMTCAPGSVLDTETGLCVKVSS